MAAGIARCLRPAASRERRRRRRRAKGPALGWAGPGPPLPGRREVERAGGRWRVRPCSRPPARPSSRRRGSAGPMRKCSPVSHGLRRPLPATSCWGGRGGALLPRPHRLSVPEVAAAAGAPERPALVRSGSPFPKGAASFPPQPQTGPFFVVINPRSVRVEGRDFGGRSSSGAGSRSAEAI